MFKSAIKRLETQGCETPISNAACFVPPPELGVGPVVPVEVAQELERANVQMRKEIDQAIARLDDIEDELVKQVEWQEP